MLSQIVITDVYYQNTYAQAAGVLIHRWSDTEPAAEYLSCSDEIDAYVSGQFYQRELPHLLRLLHTIESYESINRYKVKFILNPIMNSILSPK